MKIFIYGDSNTWGQEPNLEAYSKNAQIDRYPNACIWWSQIAKENTVIVNGLSGRSISNEHPYLTGRNAMLTIAEDLKQHINADVIILQLGTNDCKSQYNLSAQQIAQNMAQLISIIKTQSRAKIILLSPAKIREGNAITDKYYAGAEAKSVALNEEYKKLAKAIGCEFVSCLKAEVGEDGEHLTMSGHYQVGKKVQECIEKIQNKQKILNLKTGRNIY